MTPTDDPTFDRAAARAASEAATERPVPNWGVLVVTVAACLTVMWTVLLLWAAANAVCGLFG